MALVNAYAVRTAGGAGRANNAAATYTVPVGRIFLCTEFYLSSQDATGAMAFLTTGAGGGVPANDVAAIHCILALNPVQQFVFGTPIEFAAGTVVTVDDDPTTGGANTSRFVGFRGYTK
ncbi:MAG: hypothetical protein ABIH23_32555 [bacterium]